MSADFGTYDLSFMPDTIPKTLVAFITDDVPTSRQRIAPLSRPAPQPEVRFVGTVSTLRKYRVNKSLRWGHFKGATPRDLIFGRGDECDVKVSNQTVSRVHASLQLTKSTTGFVVLYNHSRNGTRLDGKIVPPSGLVVNEGSIIEIGDRKFVFEYGAARENAGVTVK
jgi:pSer/pThr/pTyr-binding forkhead associated (FHA) protein